MRPGMGHEIVQTKPFGPLHLDDKRLQRPAIEHLIRTRQINEVGVVREQVPDLGLASCILKQLDFVFRQGLGRPLIGVLGEQLQGFAIVVLRRQQVAYG